MTVVMKWKTRSQKGYPVTRLQLGYGNLLLGAARPCLKRRIGLRGERKPASIFWCGVVIGVRSLWSGPRAIGPRFTSREGRPVDPHATRASSDRSFAIWSALECL
jgi:hypothetical protein